MVDSTQIVCLIVVFLLLFESLHLHNTSLRMCICA